MNCNLFSSISENDFHLFLDESTKINSGNIFLNAKEEEIELMKNVLQVIQEKETPLRRWNKDHYESCEKTNLLFDNSSFDKTLKVNFISQGEERIKEWDILLRTIYSCIINIIPQYTSLAKWLCNQIMRYETFLYHPRKEKNNENEPLHHYTIGIYHDKDVYLLISITKTLNPHHQLGDVRIIFKVVYINKDYFSNSSLSFTRENIHQYTKERIELEMKHKQHKNLLQMKKSKSKTKSSSFSSLSSSFISLFQRKKVIKNGIKNFMIKKLTLKS